ncbi:MAG: DUF2659 family protein [Rhodospirillales bacterium]
MSDIFQEIDEDLRRDRLTELWKRYGNYLAAAAALIVLGTAGIVGWREYRERQNKAQADVFIKAMEQAQTGETDAAKAAFARLAKDAGAGYAMLARLQQAALLSKAGDAAGAVMLYEEIAADGRVEQALRDLAVLLIAQNTIDSADPAQLTQRLSSLAQDKNPWRHTAMELQALLAKRAGDTAKAKEIYTKLADDLSAPQSLRARATEMLAILGG